MRSVEASSSALFAPDSGCFSHIRTGHDLGPSPNTPNPPVPNCFVFVLLTLLVIASGFLLIPPSASAQMKADSLAIRQVALDYINGWYTGDAERIQSALHPALQKRMVYTDTRTEADSLDQQTAETLVENTRTRTPTPESKQRTEVTVLDVYGDAASVRVDAQRWVDYLHVLKWRGDWKIINVLWELRRQPNASG